MLEYDLTIGAEVVDLQEVKVALFVLQEVANEHVHGALFFGVNVGLSENFVDSVNRGDGLWIRIWHALDLHTVVIAVAVDRE